MEKLTDIKEEFGPEVLLYYAGSGSEGFLNKLAMAFWHQYGGYTEVYGSFCWAAGIEGTRLVYGTNIHSDPRDIANSKLIVIWGKNPDFSGVI